MKRIISIAIVLAVVMTAFSGCALGQKLTAFGLYSKAVNTIREAGGFEVDSVVSFSFDSELLQGVGIAIGMNVRHNGDNSRVEVRMVGEPLVVTTIIGDTVYVDTQGTKLSYSMPESSKKTDSVVEAEVLPQLAKDIFNGIEVVNNEDGTKSVTMNLEGEAIGDILGEATASGFSDDLSISFDNVVMTLNFDENDELTTMHLTCKAAYTVIGITIVGDMTADYTFINLGTAPEISAPDDADSYEFSGEYAA